MNSDLFRFLKKIFLFAVVILAVVAVVSALFMTATTYRSATLSVNRDAVLNEVVTLAYEAQQYHHRGLERGETRGFEGLSFRQITFPAEETSDNDMTAVNQNGTYHLSQVERNQFTITGHPASCAGYSRKQTCDKAEDRVIAHVTPTNITWE